MKIIDLLNKIASGEELPKKIYCFNREFYLKENTYFGDIFTLMHYIQEEDLNETVEIIEEKKQRKLDQYKNNWEELKGYIKKFPGISYASSEKVDGERLSGKLIPVTKVLNKMKELEGE